MATLAIFAPREGPQKRLSAQAPHLSQPAKAASSLALLRLLSPPDPLRWAPAGAPVFSGGERSSKFHPLRTPGILRELSCGKIGIGERKRSGGSAFSPQGGNKRSAACADEAARGRGTASALIPADADPALAPPSAALEICAAFWQYLTVPPRDPKLRLPTPAQAGAVQEANLPG